MIWIAALALSLTVGGDDFARGFVRAKKYEHEPAARQFLEKVFFPKVGPQITQAFGDCAKRLAPKADVYFTVVISYRDGKPDAVLLDQEAPFGRCMSENLAKVVYPEGPPYPDFAEDIEFNMHFK